MYQRTQTFNEIVFYSNCIPANISSRERELWAMQARERRRRSAGFLVEGGRGSNDKYKQPFEKLTSQYFQYFYLLFIYQIMHNIINTIKPPPREVSHIGTSK